MRSGRSLRIALAFPVGLVFLERVQQGIADFARAQGRWTFTRAPETLGPSIEWLRSWPGDGAVALITTPADRRVAAKLPFPVVNLAGYMPDAGAPAVMVDHRTIGRFAAEHLLARRFRRLGYYGARGLWYGRLRRLGFEDAVRQAGAECSALEAAIGGGGARLWTDQTLELERWLKTLRPPAGILASTDQRASMVLDACARLGLRVPEDVAVIGVDNDPVACEFCTPALTSVSRNDYQVGREAAALLARLMAGKTPPKQPILVPPDGIVQRRSTETLVVEDPVVAAAVRFVHQHVSERFGVERLLAEVPLSRRRLEHRFRECLGCTPYEFITRARVERARQLLAETPRARLTAVAAACGFTDLRRFRLVFRREAGVKPAEYRREALAAGRRAPTQNGPCCTQGGSCP